MIHAYKSNGYNIIIDANSGSVHAVDEVAFDAISNYEKMERADLTAFLLDQYKDNPDVTEAEIEDIRESMREYLALAEDCRRAT